MIILLPWASADLSPNASSPGKWRKKSNAASVYGWQCVEAMSKQKIGPWLGSNPHVSVTFHPPKGAERYDLDNALARIKQGLDRLGSKIRCDDGKWQSMSLHRGAISNPAHVKVEISEPTRGH